MRIKRNILPLFLIICCIGIAHGQSSKQRFLYQQNGEVKVLKDKHDFVIHTMDGKISEKSILSTMSPESLVFKDRENEDKMMHYAAENIKMLTMNVRGARKKTAIMGGIGGALLGGVAGVAVLGENDNVATFCRDCRNGTEAALLGAAIGVLPGALIGYLAGDKKKQRIINGRKDELEVFVQDFLTTDPN